MGCARMANREFSQGGVAAMAERFGFRPPQGRHWHPAELAAMIVGFVLFWPIGLAILGWKLMRDGGWRGATTRNDLPRDLSVDTGNSAFEDYKRAELARLEEERRRLAEEQSAFGDFMDRLKRARDREEFEKFLGERRGPQPQPGA